MDTPAKQLRVQQRPLAGPLDKVKDLSRSMMRLVDLRHLVCRRREVSDRMTREKQQMDLAPRPVLVGRSQT